MAEVRSSASIGVYLESGAATVQDVRDWLAEVDRLHIPGDTRLDDCLLDLVYRSEIIEETYGESALGVEGYDILVGMPR